MYVKICGLSTVESARAALNAGADAVGMVMSRRSRRNVSVPTARSIADFVGSAADVVLVVDALPVDEAASLAREIGADVLQLHGDAYGPHDFIAAGAVMPRLWRATSATAHAKFEVGSWGEEALLLDSPDPGSGVRWDSSDLRVEPAGKWLLAGGLNPDNVSTAVASAQPWGVDVSSGVESAPGVKSNALIAAFVTAARGS
ncbi:phosphoribosylanthranilate isomerase [Microbacterium xylanilyticum]